jgi:hypothetical protein
MTDSPATTTAPVAVTTPDPTPPAVPALDPAAELDALRAKYEKAQKDIEKFRTRADAVEAAQKAAEAERLKSAPLEERLKALETEREELVQKAAREAEARVNAERLATLAGKVANPKAALKLLEEAHLTSDGGVNVDALLAEFPFLAPSARGVAPAVTGAPLSARALTADVIASLTPDEVNARWDEIRAFYTARR